MKLCILLVLFSFCNGSENKGDFTPVNYESDLKSYEKSDDYKILASYLEPRGNDGFRKIKGYGDDSKSIYGEDIEKVEEDFAEYISDGKNYNRYDDKNYRGRERKYDDEKERKYDDEDWNRYEGKGYRERERKYADEDWNRYEGKGYRERERKYDDEEYKERLDKMFGYTGPTAKDEPENLIRPCALDDWQCIRKYFAANSKCKPAYGPIPDPLFLASNNLFIFVANLTVTMTNSEIRGLSNAKINDFYVNKKTGNLVFAIDVTNLNMTAPTSYFRYRRMAKESIILGDYGTVNFRSVTFTAVIPKVPDLRLDLADIHTDAHDGTPAVFFGPGVNNSTDPEVQAGYASFIANLPIVIREGFFTQSQLTTALYIQRNICDFGLKLINM